MNKVKIAEELVKVAKELTNVKCAKVDADDIFKHEYEQQIKNTLEKELMELQHKLSKTMLPWIKERFDDYHVQRYVERESMEDKAEIKKMLEKKALRLLMDAVNTNRLKKL